MRKELENRLVSLSFDIDKFCKGLNSGHMADHFSKQVIRSSTSAALNYGDAQAAESKKVFIHKVSTVIKELREIQISLKLLSGSINDNARILYARYLDECDQLIAIFHKTVMSAKARK